MPSAWAAIVIRVWSNVASAVLNPVPSAPMIRSAGIRVSSKITCRVGDPLIPSLRSLAPNDTPGSDFSTTNAEIPRAPAAGSVTAITV
ncbi:Uncharacterised protein [Mycobacterium tuberculosis]|nr:Uncharacterised protein [Mycobacterium tuberculosis]